MVMVVVVVLVPVKKRKKREKKKKTTCIGGGAQLFSTTQNSIGGGKATLKDRGDVVLVGTRRVFAHVARKENFSTPPSISYVVGTFRREEEKEQERSRVKE